jgi:hypothetical protein
MRIILLICVFTLLLSVTSFIAVLAIQRTGSDSSSWDFQGASGAAVIIPSFAGVVLAAWAIYLQMRSNSPSYRAAEVAWFEISKLYRKVLHVSLFLWSVDTEDQYYDGPEPTDEELAAIKEQESEPVLPWESERREAERKSSDIYRREFKTNKDEDAQSPSTLLDLAVSTFPVLDALQEKLIVSHRVNLTAMQSSLYQMSVSIEFDEPGKVIAARLVLRKIQELIERLDASGALNLNVIERALWRPHQAAKLRSLFEDDDASKEALAARVSIAPSEAVARLRTLATGASGTRPKSKIF